MTRTTHSFGFLILPLAVALMLTGLMAGANDTAEAASQDLVVVRCTAEAATQARR
jgi:hypothetical protein